MAGAIAFILKGYPRLSETFIANEIRALEKRGGEAETTNNRMEVTAAIEALQALKAPGQDIELRTDSRYLKDMAESWMAGWKRRGWRKRSGEPVANLDLVQALDVLLQLHRHRSSHRHV